MKEVTESYAVAAEVQRLVAAMGGGARAVERGSGVLVLDVCSGKGIGANLVSRLLPEARVVMLDVDTEMDLCHVAGRRGLSFEPLDLFSSRAASQLRRLARAAAADGMPLCVAVGMHLCGQLAPRLLSLAAAVPEIAAVAVCPCCLKGSLGQEVKRRARLSGEAHGRVLVEALAEHAGREAAAAALAASTMCRSSSTSAEARVDVRFDDAMLSPRNGFVSVAKV